MRLADIPDYFALKRHLVRPWEFVRLRGKTVTEPRIEVAFRDGGTFRLRPEDRHVFHRMFARDEYHLDAVPPGSWDTVIDVGAHVGTFAVRVAPLARRVLSYEPTPDSFELLAANVARFPHVRAHNLAVAGRRGTLTLFPGKAHSRNSILPLEDVRTSEGIAVEAVTLEDVFREHAIERCDLLKMDVEGAEYEILYALPAEYWARIRRVRMEYHLVTGRGEEWTGEGLARHLEKMGLRPTMTPHRKKPGLGLIFSERAER